MGRQDAYDGREAKKHEVEMRNKDNEQGHLGSRWDDMQVGNDMLHFGKVKLEHLKAGVNPANDRFREDGKCLDNEEL